MNKRVIKIALLSVVLSGAMASCQKEEILVSQELSQKSLAQETSILFFKIDGEEDYRKFGSTEERDEFILYLIHLTREGHIVIIESNENPEYAPEEKDKQKFETTDEKEMLIWTIEMRDKGYRSEEHTSELQSHTEI
ncbi:MAG: hypothetical protein IKT84_08250, partial [Bacteroidales bacterium]|nr:hypothetical protein [Bacteroidales bacterium]